MSKKKGFLLVPSQLVYPFKMKKRACKCDNTFCTSLNFQVSFSLCFREIQPLDGNKTIVLYLQAKEHLTKV